MIGDAAEDIGQPCLWINAVQLGGFDQGLAIAADLPPRADPAKRQFYLPMAIARMPLSTPADQWPFSEEKFIRFYTRALRRPSNTFLVCIRYKGKTVGMFHAGIGDYYLGVGGRMVTIYALYVIARVRRTYLGGIVGVRLLRLVSEWAKSQQAEEIRIHATSGIEPERTDKMLTRMGFRTYGGNYVVRLI